MWGEVTLSLEKLCSLDAPGPLSRERWSLNCPSQAGGAQKRWLGTLSAMTPGTFPSQSSAGTQGPAGSRAAWSQAGPGPCLC